MKRRQTVQTRLKLWRLNATALLLTGILAACSSVAPTDPSVPPDNATEAEAPTIDITGPSNGATVSQEDVLLTGVLNDAVTSMSYVVNGGQVWPVEFSENEYAFPVNDIVEGKNEIEVTVENADGETTVVVLVINYDPSSEGEVADTFYVSNNGPDSAGEVDTFEGAFNLESTFLVGNNEGVELDRFGDLYQAGSTKSGPSIRAISQIYTRPNGDYDPGRDREIEGPATRLVEPKGIEIAEEAGYIFVADNGEVINSDNLKVFNTLNDGNVAPVGTTNLAIKPWDLAYDEAGDRLFVALTDGTVAVFDRYVQGGFGRDGPDTILTPVDRLGKKISFNLHGIAYNANLDALVVTDVGIATTSDQEDFDTDGAIYVIHDVSDEDGNVIPGRVIKGPDTLLGNPVDVVLNGTEARVAEAAGDKLLVFKDVFFAPSGNVAADTAVDESKPASIVVSPDEFENRPDEPNEPDQPSQGQETAKRAISYIDPDTDTLTANPNVTSDSSCENPDQFDTQSVSNFGDGSTNVHLAGCLLSDRNDNSSRADTTASYETSGVGGIYSCPDPDRDGPKTSTALDTDGDGLNDRCTLEGYESDSLEYHARFLSEITGSQIVVFCADANANGCADERVRSRAEINWRGR